MRETNHETKECLVIKHIKEIVSVPLELLGVKTPMEFKKTAANLPHVAALEAAIKEANKKGIDWCKNNGRVEAIIFTESAEEISINNCHIQGIMMQTA